VLAAHPVPFRPLVACSWPITHAARIIELEAILKDGRYLMYADDIGAAVEYHRSFDPNEYCDEEQIHFQNGRLIERENLKPKPHWTEVSEPC
jgi:hypothetical protein